MAVVSRCLIFKYLPLTPALSPFGGERESDANCATIWFFVGGECYDDFFAIGQAVGWDQKSGGRIIKLLTLFT